MNRCQFRFTLDIHKHQSQVSIPVMRGDTAVDFYISLTDGGLPYTLADGCWAVFVAKKPDGSTLKNNCIIEGNTTIIYSFTEQTASAAGISLCEIRLYDRNNGLLTSPCFTMVVDERISRDDSEFVSESESTAFDQIFTSELQRQETHEQMKEALEEFTEDGGIPLLVLRVYEPWGTIDRIEAGFTDGFKYEYFNRKPRVGDVYTGCGRTLHDKLLFSYAAEITECDDVKQSATFKFIEAYSSAPSIVNITSIDTIYTSVGDLPMDVDNGTTYLVITKETAGDVLRRYVYDSGTRKWVSQGQVYPNITYVVLTGEKAGIYRRIEGEPYLVSMESHTLQEAKDYTDEKISEIGAAPGGASTGALATIRVMEPPGTVEDIKTGYANSFRTDFFNRMPRVDEEFTGVGRTSGDGLLFTYAARITGFVEEGGFTFATFVIIEACSSKTYIDSKVSDIETALDSIIAIQESLIGGN